MAEFILVQPPATPLQCMILDSIYRYPLGRNNELCSFTTSSVSQVTVVTWAERRNLNSCHSVVTWAERRNLNSCCCSRYSSSTSLLLLLFVNICLVFTTLNRGAT